MPSRTSAADLAAAHAGDLPDRRPGEYVVVARRYRPQTFEELVGQEHVARALCGAITSNRVGHAYLFTGARGVGKTSAARILAKALDCQKGISPHPCNQCDICQSISTGDDVDVLEIDGASNRGIDEMRDLRQGVNVRPSRARFKIYIIDEVHMLTKEAFNALLKTLEEPPEHVKFIFCTTEAEKIPITILSRCQRFDFAGIQTRSIGERLRQIVEAEGVQADPDALAVLARRASGSMRDGQSLLEQLLAFGGQRITVADVHAMLGTAGDERLGEIVSHLFERRPAAVLAELDAAVAAGVDIGQLLDQLLGYLRDCMAGSVGCSPDSFLHTSPAHQQAVVQAGQKLGLETILAMMQILDQTISRLRYSTQHRTLAELAVVRMCKLEDLDSLPELIGQLRSGLPLEGAARTPAPAAADLRKKKPDAAPLNSQSPAVLSPSPADLPAISGLAAPVVTPTLQIAPAPQVAAIAAAIPMSSEQAEPALASQNAEVSTAEVAQSPSVLSAIEPTSVQTLSPDSARAIWEQVLDSLSDMTAEQARVCERVAISAPNRLVVSFGAKYTSCKSFCERPDQVARLERELAKFTGQPIRVEFALLDEPSSSTEVPVRRTNSQRELLGEKSRNPLVRKAVELFDARPVKVETPDNS